MDETSAAAARACPDVAAPAPDLERQASALSPPAAQPGEEHSSIQSVRRRVATARPWKRKHHEQKTQKKIANALVFPSTRVYVLIMIKIIRIKMGAGLLSLAALGACPLNEIPEGTSPQCEGSAYTAFDLEHLQGPTAQIADQTQMQALLEEALGDSALAADRFAAAQALYAQRLQAAVRSAADDRLATGTPVGSAIDERIVSALAAGAAATTEFDIELAAETIDKALTHFFFVSVLQELGQGEAEHWDRAFAYFGADAANDLDRTQAFAGVAKRRDGNNGTAFEGAIFQNLVEGSCVLATRLLSAEADSVDVGADAELSALVDEVDVAMRRVLAASVGHEAKEIAAIQLELPSSPDDSALPNTARVKLVELDGFFIPIELLLRAAGKDAVADAVRSPLDAALADQTQAWLDSFDGATMVTVLETEFAIAILE